MRFRSILLFFLAAMVYSCGPKPQTDPDVSLLDSITRAVEQKQIEFEMSRRIIAVQKDSSNGNNQFYFELTNVDAIKSFRQFLEKNHIREYCGGFIMDREYSFYIGGIGARGDYSVATNWKPDSIAIAPSYQYYIPMAKSDWRSFINGFEKRTHKTYLISDLNVAKAAYAYCTQNNINANFQVANNSLNSWGKSNPDWLKFEGFFKFTYHPVDEDNYGNKIKVILRSEYPKEQFYIESYGIIHSDKNNYDYTVEVYCDSSFYNKFTYAKPFTKWRKMKILSSVICEGRQIKGLDSVIYRK